MDDNITLSSNNVLKIKNFHKRIKLFELLKKNASLAKKMRKMRKIE